PTGETARQIPGPVLPALGAAMMLLGSVVRVKRSRPHPEERTLVRVSKDGNESAPRNHPSRRRLHGLLRMRSENEHVGWAKAAAALPSMQCVRSAVPTRSVGWWARFALPTLQAGLLMVAISMPPAAAQSVEEFYRGKNITIAIGFSVGGGYDL